ncbi:MAG: type II toxin-antitoxin system VapC family toxin [Niveispirillum sp.]|uniref:type II toxin-antitoxin system VapC family toxin n=1 Tax=Niveispirillum sp. TaxID=1917217 RepID=UPI003BA56CF2
MTIVIDASVAVKWLISEDNSTAASPLRGFPLIAPDLLLVEVASILWKKVRLGEVPASITQAALPVLEEIGISLVTNKALVGRALELACDLNHSPYDMFYVALAIDRDIPLITADRRLVNRVRQSGHPWATLVTPLTEFQPGACAPTLS